MSDLKFKQHILAALALFVFLVIMLTWLQKCLPGLSTVKCFLLFFYPFYTFLWKGIIGPVHTQSGGE